MFPSIKIRSNFFYHSHDRILIRLSMEIKFQPILKWFFVRLFCSHHKIARKYRMENRIMWPHDGSAATFAATCHIKKSLSFVLNKTCILFLQLLSEKKRSCRNDNHYKLLNTTAIPPTMNINHWTSTQFHRQSLWTRTQFFRESL